MKYIYAFKEVNDYTLSMGGKGASLARLTSLKLPVPEGYCILAEAFSDAPAEGSRLINQDALEELKTLQNKLSSKTTYAVRSSALNEDGEGASFAGQYETITDVPVDKILDAVKEVVSSANTSRVEEYTQNMKTMKTGIGVVIQSFVKPDFAGVIFTSDVITGSSEHMVGNFVRGEGELLVSGASNAEEFKLNALKYNYEGPADFQKYGKKLYSYCTTIRKSYGCPMDIEWAVSKGKLYILQARPITTLHRGDALNYTINASLAGDYLLTKTNVGEIFMRPVSPMTADVLSSISSMLGLDGVLDHIYGQTYMNVSIICSMLMSFGLSKESAYAKVKELVGNLPEGVEIPVMPFNRKHFLSQIWGLRKYTSSKLSRKEKKEMLKNLADIARETIDHIRSLPDNASLLRYWDEDCIPSVKDGFSSIATACGTAMIPLFTTKEKITKVAGEEMANRLLSGCVGILESMKPLLLLEDLIDGKITREDYIRVCGHRCVGEMELAEPLPYEDPTFPDKLIEEHKNSGVKLSDMRKKQEEEYEKAMAEFISLYPKREKWIKNLTKSFAHANAFREDIRSKGVWILAVLREFALRAGQLNGIEQDVFMLSMEELMEILRGREIPFEIIKKRKESYERNFTYPAFPGLIVGRFIPEEWMEDAHHRNDFYSATELSLSLPSTVKGFPGAAGQVEGVVRIIPDLDHMNEFKAGEILVTTATNIGWTVLFPKASAIITDIGAPLSHAAIVAREFGIPAVVGCGNATTILKNGDHVLVDGRRGTVSIIED